MYNDTCEVTCVDNGRKVIADVLNFKQWQMLVVSLNKSIKLSLKWNGKVYEGNGTGLTFTSAGPKVR